MVLELAERKAQEMATANEEILQQLLSLPVETRAAIADKLLESIDPPDERNQQLWAEEAERRIAAYERGEMNAIPGEEVFAKLRAKFPKR
jgi:putative addiction module component (TIGR02574 family)